MSENKDQKFVYDFTEGNKDLKDLLGGKGANLAEMTNLGLPVPPGFTITTEACKVYLDSGDGARGAARRGERAPRRPRADDGQEARPGRRPAAGLRPLRREVLHARHDGHRPQHRPLRRVGGRARRSRPATSASPGTPTAASSRCSARPSSASTASSSRRRWRRPRRAKKVTVDTDLDAADLKKLVKQFKKIVSPEAGRDFPQDPREQMDLAIRAVFDSWNTDRAKLYRRQERIPGDLGTAVNVCSMVFGNLGPDSGTGVAFTRDPASGHQGVYGDYLQNAQGEDVVAGIRNTVPLAELETIDKKSYDQLMQIMETLENALQGPVRHRVHHRARPAVDAPDPGRQAHRRRRLPHRHPARRPGPDRRGRGAPAGQRRPARAADVPALRRGREGRRCSAAASPPPRARRSARPSSTRTPRSSGRAPARRSS